MELRGMLSFGGRGVAKKAHIPTLKTGLWREGNSTSDRDSKWGECAREHLSSLLDSLRTAQC